MKAHDVMTWGVISVESSAPVMRAAQSMLENKISGLPVVDASGNLVGIVTEGDFLRRGELGTQRRRPRWLEFLIGPGRLATEYVRACGRKVSEIMTPNPFTVTQETSLEDIVKLMEKNYFASIDYRTEIVIALTVLMAVGSIIVLWGLFSGTAAGLAAAVSPLSMVLPGAILARRLGWPWHCAFPMPLLFPVYQFAMVNSTWKTLRQGGVRWRDTFYSLETLRAGTVK